jgi:CubicO group peptidase (beta-lactamase class C family)
VLGILLSRVVGRPLSDQLAADLFEPLGMSDTGFWVPKDKVGRLPAAYRHGAAGLEEVEPAGGGFYAGPPPFDVSHGELVATVTDFHQFLHALTLGELISAEHLEELRSDQVAPRNKTPDSFFPGFWDGMGWGFGVGVQTEGPLRGRYGWSGGLGTDFFVDPDGSVGILLTQVELGEQTWSMISEFGQLQSAH